MRIDSKRLVKAIRFILTKFQLISKLMVDRKYVFSGIVGCLMMFDAFDLYRRGNWKNMKEFVGSNIIKPVLAREREARLNKLN